MTIYQLREKRRITDSFVLFLFFNRKKINMNMIYVVENLIGNVNVEMKIIL